MSGQRLQGASFLVLGLGSTGLALVRYLQARGATVAVADSRAEPPGLATLRAAFPEVFVHLGPFEALAFSPEQTVVVSPGLAPESLPLAVMKAVGCPVRGELDLFFEETQAPVLGITGTNGKSTVTALLGHLLAEAGYRVAVGGNLGPAAVSLLDGPAPEVFVLELSMSSSPWSSPYSTNVWSPLAIWVSGKSFDLLDRPTPPTLFLYFSPSSKSFDPLISLTERANTSV